MMSYEERKALMIIHKIKGSRIARQLEVSPATVSGVLIGKGRSVRIENAIASACGKKRLEMWPPNGRELLAMEEAVYRQGAA